jgi:hypothetical protein
MMRVRLYLVGSLVLLALAGCGRSLFNFAQREPWRRDAEVACLRSGAVKEGPALVRIEPIDGPGICGADFPLKVAALASSSAIAFADELQPPANIPNVRGGPQLRWQVGPQPVTSAPPPVTSVPPPSSDDIAAAATPLAIHPNVEGTDEDAAADAPDAELQRPSITPAHPFYRQAPAVTQPLPPLGPPRGQVTAAIGPVEVKPAATLACPIVSALDTWVATTLQPAAMRWFGQPVVAIRQISSYSCRGMNGNPHAHISEHAFGNALDIAAFTFADGRQVSVKNGWRGAPEEQGFLHDVQSGACRQFTTVLAPGSNRYHYDHMHVDLMRRTHRRIICEPEAIPGEVAAARAAQGGRYAHRGDLGITGSISSFFRRKPKPLDDEDWIEDDGPRERVD